MKPEEAFAGMTTTEWATTLCRCLLTRKEWVQRALAGQNTYDRFCTEIMSWNNMYVLNGREHHEKAAIALYGICDNFGLIELMVREGLIEKVITRGQTKPHDKTRTRGSATAAITGLQQQMAEVGKLFGVE